VTTADLYICISKLSSAGWLLPCSAAEALFLLELKGLADTYSNVFCCRLKHRELSQSNLGQWGYDKEKERDKHIQGNIEVYM